MGGNDLCKVEEKVRAKDKVRVVEAERAVNLDLALEESVPVQIAVTPLTRLTE